MLHDERIDRLERSVRRLRAGILVLLVGGGAALTIAATAPARDASFGTLTVERINVVEPDGIFRAVLTNGARSPGPMLQARAGAKEGKRNFPFAGLVLYDRDGQEQGGNGTGAAPGQGSLAVQMVDWPGGEGGGFGEAVGTFRKVDAKNVASSGLFISDRPPVGADPTQGVDHRRIKLLNVDRDAQVLLADDRGRDRIRMRVDSAGDASIEILDAAGRAVFRAPQGKRAR